MKPFPGENFDNDEIIFNKVDNITTTCIRLLKILSPFLVIRFYEIGKRKLRRSCNNSQKLETTDILLSVTYNIIRLKLNDCFASSVGLIS